MASSSNSSKASVVTWSIENFLCCIHDTGKCLKSPYFLLKDIFKTKWHFNLYPNGKNNSNLMSFRLYRENNFDDPETINVVIEAGFVREDGSMLNEFYGTVSSIKKDEELNKYSVIPRTEVNQFLKKMDTLTIFCKIWKVNQTPSEELKYFVRTRIGVAKLDFKMEFDLSNEESWSIKTFDSMKNMKWRYLWCHLTGQSQNVFLMKIQIFPMINNIDPISLCNLYLVDVHRQEKLFAFSEMKRKTFSTIKKWKFESILKWDNIVKEKDKFFPNNKLMLRGELITSYGHEIYDVIKENHNFDLLKKCCCNANISSSLYSLYEEGALCDVNLKTLTKTFFVHKTVLSAGSSVFKKMFTTDMKKVRDNTVEIEDIEEPIMERLLLYLYKNEVHILDWYSCLQLYSAADKYDVIDLRKVCSKYLKENVSADVVCQVLELTDMHHDEELLQFSRKFLAENISVFRSEEWKNLELKKHLLANKTMRKIILNDDFP